MYPTVLYMTLHIFYDDGFATFIPILNLTFWTIRLRRM